MRNVLTETLRRLNILPSSEVEEREPAAEFVEKLAGEVADDRSRVQQVSEEMKSRPDTPVTFVEFERAVAAKREEDARAERVSRGRRSLYARGRNGDDVDGRV